MPNKFVRCAQRIENLRKPIKAEPFVLPAAGIIRAVMAGKLGVAVQLVKQPIESLIDEDTMQEGAKIGAQLGNEIIEEFD